MRIRDWSSDVCSSDLLPHVRGAGAAARQGSAPNADDETHIKAENSANSQFFIVFQPKLQLDKDYTVFGRVIGGMQYVDAIHRGEPPADPSRILHAYIAADNPPPYQPAPAAAPAATPTVLPGTRSEERRVGKEGVRTCSSRWSPLH